MSVCACSEAVALQYCRNYDICSLAHMKRVGRSCTVLVIWTLFGQMGPILRQRAKWFSDVSAVLGFSFWH